MFSMIIYNRIVFPYSGLDPEVQYHPEKRLFACLYPPPLLTDTGANEQSEKQ